jgi:hypothetical protein
VRVTGTTCQTGFRVLAAAGRGEKPPSGFHCRVVSRAPSGQGFPVDRVCRHGRATVSGRISDSGP